MREYTEKPNLQSTKDSKVSHSNIKVLVVGSDIEFQALFSTNFRNRIDQGDWRLVFADNSADALDRIAEDSGIDVVLSEIDASPSADFWFLDALGETAFNISVIILSPRDEMNDARYAMNRGAFDFLAKPIDWGVLESTIDRAAQRSRVIREIFTQRDQRVALIRELELARNLLSSILPKSMPSGDSFDLQGSVFQTEEQFRDFYDHYELKSGELGIVTINVSDNGFAGVRLMMICSALIKEIAGDSRSPVEVLSKANELLLLQNPSAMTVSVFYGVFNPENGQLTYTIAGQSLAVVRRRDGSTEILQGTGAPALGVDTGAQFVESSITLVGNELVCLVTDGLSNLMNEKGEAFGNEQLQSAVAALKPDSAINTASTLLESFNKFAGNAKRTDSLACLVLGITSGIATSKASTLEFVLKNDTSDLTRLAEVVDEFSDQNKFSEQTRFGLQLCLEELALNVIDYGYDDLGEHDIQINISFETETGTITVQFMDDGRKFNPLEEVVEYDLDASLESRGIGGLGFHLVRNFTDDIQYFRENKRNHLILTKTVEG